MNEPRRAKRLRLTRPKVDRAVIALEALLDCDLPDTGEFQDADVRSLIEHALWDAVQPLDRLFREDDDD